MAHFLPSFCILYDDPKTGVSLLYIIRHLFTYEWSMQGKNGRKTEIVYPVDRGGGWDGRRGDFDVLSTSLNDD